MRFWEEILKSIIKGNNHILQIQKYSVLSKNVIGKGKIQLQKNKYFHKLFHWLQRSTNISSNEIYFEKATVVFLGD